MPLFLAPPTDRPTDRSARPRHCTAGSLITGVIMLRAPEEEVRKGERDTKSFSKRQKHDISTCRSVGRTIVMVPRTGTALNGSFMPPVIHCAIRHYCFPSSKAVPHSGPICLCLSVSARQDSMIGKQHSRGKGGLPIILMPIGKEREGY